MQTQPQVSVVMGAYNDAPHLHRSVPSILTQDGVDLEFIIVNDGSTDSSHDVLAGYAGQDDRIRLIDQENTGLTKALIRGCAEAGGEYIARQDADDVSLPGRLQRLAARLDSDRRLAFVSSWAQAVGPNDEVFADHCRPEDPQAATRQLLHERVGPPGHGSVMFRKGAYDHVGGYRQEFYYGQDSDLWLRMGLHGMLAYEQAFLYQFRFDAADISSAHREIQNQFGEIGQACHAARLRGESDAEFLAKADELRAVVASRRKSHPEPPRRAAAGYYFIGSGLAKRGDGRAAAYFWRAIKADPLHMRAWLGLGLCLAKRLPGVPRAASG